MLNDKLKALLTLSGISQKDLSEKKGIAKQQLSNKLRNGAYKLDELVDLADLTGTTLAFIDDKGKPVISFDIDDIPKKTDK